MYSHDHYLRAIHRTDDESAAVGTIPRDPEPDFSKLVALAEIASRQPYLPVPENMTSQANTTRDEVGDTPSWEVLLEAADHAYQQDFPPSARQLAFRSRANQPAPKPRRGAKPGQPWRKPWSSTEDATLITLKSKGLSFKDMKGKITGRAVAGIQQRWYKIKHKLDTGSSDGDESSDLSELESVADTDAGDYHEENESAVADMDVDR